MRWLSDGHLEYIARNDSQVKIRGHRIELGEIENELCTLPEVSQAVVIDYKKNETTVLAAYIVSDLGESIGADKLRDTLVSKLPDYMIPSTFTYLDSVPLTINGKLDRRALPEPEFVNNESYVAPTTELEKQLCDIWQDILGLEQVGIEDNFFRIGGNSISAVRMSELSSRLIGTRIPINLLFKFGTITCLVEHLATGNMAIIPRQSDQKGKVSIEI